MSKSMSKSMSKISRTTHTKPLDSALMAAHSAFLYMERPSYEKGDIFICDIT